MKGKTKIILTNVETGEKEIHEHENLVTSAIDKLINITLAMNYAPNTKLLPFATNALGGLMLFDGELYEDKDNIHFPTEAHLVGYADQAVNTDDKFRGSYNEIESGKTQSGFVSVWDFGTGQANGSIHALARTHAVAGACPVYYYLDGGNSTSEGSLVSDQGWTPIRYDGEYVYMLKGDSSTHTMRLARTKIPMLKMGSGDYNDVERSYELLASWGTHVCSFEYYRDARQEDTYQQHVYADNVQMYEDGHDGYIYAMFYKAYTNYGCANGFDERNIVYFRIRYDDESYQKSNTIFNSGPELLYGYTEQHMYYAGRVWGHVCRGVLYRVKDDRKSIYIIPLNNAASYLRVQVLPAAGQDYIAGLQYCSPHGGGVWFDVYHYTDTGYLYRCGILYPDGEFVIIEKPYQSPVTSPPHYNSSFYGNLPCVSDELVAFTRYGSGFIYRGWTPNYLGTINNLPSPIVKTAAQTMKVVYTLTDVDEEEET